MPVRKTYDNTSITQLKDEDRVRKRPGVIFGSDGLEGCQHAVFEILSNSIDEAREGHGKTIRVTVFADHSIEISDDGRGCPVDWNEREGRYNWELVFCELYAGGKYHNAADENYEFSLGLNGLGSCATQYASEWMDVTVLRDGFEYTLRFEKGKNIGGLNKEPYSGRKTGSRHRWKPDRDVFTDIAVPLEYFTDTLRKQAVVNPSVTFLLDYMGQKHSFFYQNGIMDYIRERQLGGRDGETEDETPPYITEPVFWSAERRGRDREDKPEYKVRLSAAFCFSQTAAFCEHYHNSSYLEHGGSPDKAVRSAFVSALDAYCKANGKYQKAESRVTWADAAECLCFVSSNFSTATSYENQTKKAVNNRYIQECMTDWLKSSLEVYLIENKAAAEAIAAQVLVNKRSRETAEKTRLGLKKKLSGTMDITTRVGKFHDCRTKDLDRREVYIVEGDSALGACKLARDSEFQAIVPVRGKILNCLKADLDKILKNEIITDLVKVLGCGIETKTKKGNASFNLSALRWNKVIICTDADVDGFHIRTMILTMLHRLTPTLIEEGYVYIAESPLFELIYKDKTAFAWSDAEKESILEQWGRPKGAQINRSKGLGENEPDMMWLTTMSPETRRLVQVTPEDAASTAEVFDMLLGDNLAARKTFIAEHGFEYLELADIS
ncbi:MAG: toprim domain-containing protein [Oscillospiraceae bacterium]|nr:toprim domain-containing protein [Oscillospiraceae bacterium]